MGGIVDVVTGKGGERAATASTDAANIAARAQREGLEYLKEREALPQQFREGALTRLAGVYGLPGGEGTQEAMIERAMASPLYQHMLSEGQGAVLRGASATGGLRSGAASENLARVQNEAMINAYNQQLTGLQGMANLPSMAPQIAQATAAPGQTMAQGIVAGAQAEQMANQNLMQGLFGLGGAALMGGAFSDIRTKTNIRHIGKKNGHNIYQWDWNELGNEIGLTGSATGVMAHEIYETDPDAVTVQDGLLLVDYGKLGLLEAA